MVIDPRHAVGTPHGDWSAQRGRSRTPGTQPSGRYAGRCRRSSFGRQRIPALHSRRTPDCGHPLQAGLRARRSWSLAFPNAFRRPVAVR